MPYDKESFLKGFIAGLSLWGRPSWRSSFVPSENSVNSVYIALTPAKRIYQPNEAMDYTGIAVCAILGNGERRDITQSCEFTPAPGSLIPSGSSRPYIFIASPPNQTIYRAGEALNYTGIVVRKKLADGSEEIITNACVFAPESGSAVYPET